MLGGDYQGHYGQGPQTKITLTDAGRKHPITSGFEPFESTGSLYKNPHLADDAQVLLSGGIVDAEGTAHSEPIAWVRDSPQRRVFYTSLGHPDDFAQQSFRQLLAQALFWTVRRDVETKPAR